MDIVEAEGIKMPNSVIVSGLTNIEHDNGLIDTLKRMALLSEPSLLVTKFQSFIRAQ